MENTISHQTVRLAVGRHVSPRAGACVMELASMLAGESFSDHPRSVCPALGALLRPYNDSLDEDRRQDLYPYAARVVGTGGHRALTRRRVQAALAFFEEHDRGARPGRLRRLLPGARLTAVARASARYARGIDAESHARMLALIDGLIALGAEEPAYLEAELAVTSSANERAGARAGRRW